MIRLPVAEWTHVCGIMRQEDGNFLVPPICEWLTGLVDQARQAGRSHLEIYEGNVEFEVVREYCLKEGYIK